MNSVMMNAGPWSQYKVGIGWMMISGPYSMLCSWLFPRFLFSVSIRFPIPKELATLIYGRANMLAPGADQEGVSTLTRNEHLT